MSGVQSVERAFAIIGCLSGGTAGVSDIAERVGLPKSTVSRLLLTLVELGVAEQTGPGGGYRLGPYLHRLAGAALPVRSLIDRARPHLVELVQSVGESAGLSILDGSQVLYLDQVTADGDIQVRDWSGERLDPHLVSSGLVLLGGASEQVVEALLSNPLASLTPHSVTDPRHIRERIAMATSVGYAWAVDELSIGMSSVAAPIVDRAGKVVAAVHVHGPTFRFRPRMTTGPDVVVDRLVASAARISESIAETETM
jgi:DNA-binding IclR family transcriptional regulator